MVFLLDYARNQVSYALYDQVQVFLVVANVDPHLVGHEIWPHSRIDQIERIEEVHVFRHRRDAEDLPKDRLLLQSVAALVIGKECALANKVVHDVLVLEQLAHDPDDLQVILSWLFDRERDQLGVDPLEDGRQDYFAVINQL